MRCLAIDIGGTKIAAVLVQIENETAQIHLRQQIATPQTDVVNGMHHCLRQLVQDYAHKFDYIAVASTGIINKGILTALNPKNLGGLAQFPLKASLAQHTDKPIFLLNDVQAAAYAEYQQQNRSEISNFAFITISTGVGGGIILNGQLLTEPNGIAGHIGHSLADPHGPVCGCGRVGCVEAVAAGRAIEAATQNWTLPCSPKQVFELFRQKDTRASEIIHRSAAAIANLVADLVISLDIQKIVIGGSVGLAEGYLPLVQQYLDQMPAVYRCSLQLAQYGGDAGLIGCAIWAKELLKRMKDVNETA
ncbi:MAG: N-acetylmannosamine kinase [Pasteurellaceae bacterium]|nr:N-acetylmannosamine kinase [Pasteurellaceae bacterium]